MKRPLLCFKWLVSRFCLIDNYCHRCGRKAEPYRVPDIVWRLVTDDSAPLCFACFHRAAECRGLPYIWDVKVGR